MRSTAMLRLCVCPRVLRIRVAGKPGKVPNCLPSSGPSSCARSSGTTNKCSDLYSVSSSSLSGAALVHRPARATREVHSPRLCSCQRDGGCTSVRERAFELVASGGVRLRVVGVQRRGPFGPTTGPRHRQRTVSDSTPMLWGWGPVDSSMPSKSLYATNPCPTGLTPPRTGRVGDSAGLVVGFGPITNGSRPHGRIEPMPR